MRDTSPRASGNACISHWLQSRHGPPTLGIQKYVYFPFCNWPSTASSHILASPYSLLARCSIGGTSRQHRGLL